MFRHLPRDSWRSGARALPRESRLPGAGGHSSHVAPRSCTKGETASAIAMYLYSAWTDHNQRGTSRARAVSSRVSPTPERQPPQWRRFAWHANAGCALEATARTSNHDHEPKERCLPPVQCPLMVRRPITASAARRARAASSCVLSPPETHPTMGRSRVGYTKAGCVLEVLARTSSHGLARGKRGLPPVRCYSIARRPITTSAAWRARGKLACFATT